MPHHAAQHSQGSPSGTLLGVCLMVLMATLDLSIVNVSLPSLVRELNTDFPTIQWVILGYTLALTCLMLTVSRLGDMYGKKETYMLGLIIFTVASVLCGLAPNAEWLIAFRGVQGVGAAMSQAMGLAIVTEVVPPERRGRAIGIIGGTVSVGLCAGPSVGGVLIGLLGWRSIFLINAPIGVAAWLIFQRSAPNLPPADKGARFDLAGALTLLAALGCYCLGMTWGQDDSFSSPPVLAMLAASVVGALVFVYIEKVKDQPMLDLSLFRNALFSTNLLMSMLSFVGMAGMFMAPFYLQYGLKLEPTAVGVLMITAPLCMGVVSPWAGSLADRHNPRAIALLGLILCFCGAVLMACIDAGEGWLGFVLRIAPIGFGLGLFQAPNNTSIMSLAPRSQLGVASGLLNYTRVFGQTTGLPIMGSVFAMLVLQAAPGAGEALTNAPPHVLADALGGVYAVSAWIYGAVVLLAAGALLLSRNGAAAEPEG